MTLTIRTWPDPILLEACSPWNFSSPPLDPIKLETDLADTILDRRALGLAANQVGIGYRVLEMHVQKNLQLITMYNPVLISASQDLWEHEEGCLSFPGVELTIARPHTVRVRWNNKYGDFQERDFHKIDAKCFLHELDHLDGKVFKDYVSDLKYRRAEKKARKR